VPQVAVHRTWAPPRFFFEISCPDRSYGHGQQPNLASKIQTPPPSLCSNPRGGSPFIFRSDMTFRQATPVFSSKTVPYLTLWDDVIEVPPNPKLYIYQRPIPDCTCGTKGLRVFDQPNSCIPVLYDWIEPRAGFFQRAPRGSGSLHTTYWVASMGVGL